MRDLINSFKPASTINDPFIINEPGRMLDLKLIFKNYSRQCFRLALKEYRLESAFTILQPEFLLFEYDRNARKYGVKSEFKEELNISRQEKSEKEDALSFMADICALYAKNNPDLFDPSIQVEAKAVLNRDDQFEFNELYLGFGYFIKRICANGNYATIAITDWFEKYLLEHEIIYTYIVKEVNCTLVVKGKGEEVKKEPTSLTILCTYMFHNEVKPRIIRINADFADNKFSLYKTKSQRRAHVFSQEMLVDLEEILYRING